MGYTFNNAFNDLQRAFDAEIAHHGLIVDDGWVRISENQNGMPGLSLKLLSEQRTLEFINAPQYIAVIINRETVNGGLPRRRSNALMILAKEFFKHRGEYVTYRLNNFNQQGRASLEVSPVGVGLLFQNNNGTPFSGPGYDLKPYAP